MLKNRGGFALPTVLIASVVMLAVLVTSISAVAATRTALQSQFFAQLARTAAESGLAMAESCINSGVPTWDSPLRTGGTCAGLAAPCSDSACYLVMSEGYRTSFSVSAPTVAGDASTAQVTGIVEQVRTSTGGVIRTYSQPLRQKDVRDGRKFSWQQISSTTNHTCAITSDGKLYCWGANDNGQLGSGTTTDRINPTLVQQGAIPNGVTIQSVAAGGNFTCALGSNYKVYCWGLGSALGAGTSTDSTTPVAVSQGAVPAGVTFQSIFAGQRHACAIASNSLTYCWGVNSNGQLGDGSTTDRLTPVALTQGALPSGSRLQSMSLGVDYSCAVASDDKAYCWGTNINGQLGDGTGTQRSNPVAVALGAMPAGSTVLKIATNTSHTCAIASNNRTYCWGLNGSGQLGDGTTTIRLTAVQASQGAMPSGAMVIQISLGSSHTCAIASDNKVYCWGNNALGGQLGNNSSSNTTIPVAVSQGVMPSDRFATSISLGSTHSCAIGSSNLVYCWGANARGQLGDGTTTQRSTPVATSSVFDTATRPIFNIQAAGGASGVSYNCAIASDNKGYCWGLNSSGQLGNSTTTSSSSPVAVAQGAMPANATIRQISAGATAACAVASDNKAYCWGSNVVNWSGTNRYGALGNGTTNSSSVPVAVAQGAMPAGATIRQISAGYNGACAIASDNKVYCWGVNFYGQLGNGTTTDSLTPVAVSQGAIPAGATIRSISVGPDFFTCAIASDNKTYCWGYNGNGELGNGTTSNSSTPVAVTQGSMPSTTVRSVVAGYMMACAIGADSKAYCWGSDYDGGLGDGTTGTILRTPVPVAQGAMPVGSTIRQLAAGVKGACVVASDNKPYCWGDNSQGQIGDSTTTNRLTATAVLQGAMPAGSTAVAIYAGSLYNCITASNNNGYCWGYNNSGQLGDGTTTTRRTPTAVVALPLFPPLQTTTYYF